MAHNARLFFSVVLESHEARAEMLFMRLINSILECIINLRSLHRPVKQKNSVKLQLFSYPSVKTYVWVLKRTVSSRRFFWVTTTYVQVEK